MPSRGEQHDGRTTRREIERAAKQMIAAGLMEERINPETNEKEWRLTEKGKQHAEDLDA